MNASHWIVAIAAAAAAGCSASTAGVSPAPNGYGVLVMAHGGSRDWNKAVLDAVKPLGGAYPVEVAFGMAEPASLERSVAKLEARGATRIGVVRLFVSGDSFLERTEQILGLSPGAPAKPSTDEHSPADQHGEHGMELWRIASSATFALSTEGLNEAPEMGGVLVDRTRKLSRDPPREDVVIVAHGPGDDEENRRWIEHMDRRADAVRAALPFNSVRVATLREDWPDKRVAAERAIRELLQTSAAEGRRAIVVPFRVEGFGPYAQVLDGLDYAADGVGLLPHENVTLWIERLAKELEGADPPAARR